ncbi:XRE family transcriptional regulator [Aeromonas caviae]|uniref:XRE family transcriptional regulator n=1 Tax=Aeromonas caviae TaxID=648 RepID=UPI0038D12373
MNDEKTESVFSDDTKNRFQDRLKALIGDSSNNQFAINCGIKESTIRSYLSGKASPNLTTLEKIAQGARCSIGWLVSGELDDPHMRVQEQAGKYSDAFSDEFALIPGYGVQVSAGHGSLTQGETEPCRHLAFRRKWLKWRGFTEKDLAIVWSKGDSMEPTISNNDTLVVHLGRTRPVDGHIFVVRNDDQLWVKRIQARPGAWVLLSDNPLYPPVEIPKDEQHTFEVIGQVVHIAHDVGE